MKNVLSGLKNFCLRGAVICALFGFLIFIIIRAAQFIDNIGMNILNLLPGGYELTYFYGLGLIFAFIAVTAIGALASLEIKNKNLFNLSLRFLGKIASRVPVLNIVYNHCFKFISGAIDLWHNGKLVFARHPYWNHSALSILTRKVKISSDGSGEEETCGLVFFPTAPFFATGPTGICSEKDIKIPVNMSWAEAIAYWISAGVVAPDVIKLKPLDIGDMEI